MRILLIDAYDSYTYNLVALFQDNFQDHKQFGNGEIDEIIVIHHDACQWEELSQCMSSFDAVVISPGPGNPHVTEDVHLIADVFKTNDVPLLGVCLGMQSLVVAHGGKVTQMKQVKHGIVNLIDHSGDDLFRDVAAECYGTRYQSLHVHKKDLPEQLIPLAFTTAKDEDEPCLMACRHATLPHWGVQYHPDSICSNYGHIIIKNFMEMAREFNTAQRRAVKSLPKHFRKLYRSSPNPIMPSIKRKNIMRLSLKLLDVGQPVKVETLRQVLQKEFPSDDFALLDSAASPGEWSYFSSTSSGMFRINYNIGNQMLQDTRRLEHVTASMDEVWIILKDIMEERMLAIDSPQPIAPFCGGFIGWFSYEAGLQSMGLKNIKLDNSASDVALVFTERSIAINTLTNIIYVQSIADNDEDWVTNMASKLMLALNDDLEESKISSDLHLAPNIESPVKEEYLEKVDEAKDQMRRGNSYEICLTDQTVINLNNRDPWQTYLSVREINPAPYAVFLKLGHETLLGSSPEMFLRCEKGLCELRPIKGTLKKTKSMDLIKAKKVLNNEKDRAENLMIVDLLRHDLNQVADTGSVKVSQLMVVEEFATVFQLVSSITGKVTEPYTGLDILARTLPPGSMTGAPKRRTCEILQNLENRPRGVYSGVVGYWSISDNHLWSVVIRSAYQARHNSSAFDFQCTTQSESQWRVGAGGALLAVSSPEAEWEEMKIKADSIINGLLASQTGFDILESIFFDDEAKDQSPLWSRHLRRLTEACTHFGYTVPSENKILQLIQEKKLPGRRQKVRLTCQKSGECTVDCQSLAPTPESLNVKLDTHPTMLPNFDFIRYKTTHRDHYDSARLRTGTQGLDEVLLHTEDGLLMEGSVFNFAVWRQAASDLGQWVTPESSTCLKGIMRDKLLEEGRIYEGLVYRDDVRVGEKIMLFNAVRGICWGILVS